MEAARIAMCIGQYANLGALIQKYAADTHVIEPFFDLAALREGSQVFFTGSIKPAAFKNILVHTFAPGDGLKLSNEGSTGLQFYLAAQKEDAPNGTTVVVPAGQTLTVAASQLGAAGNRFLNVNNPGTTNKGDWTVEFV